ncbi:uncharacterized protein LOC114523822 [Dendronephthya gigantea]|uniref:uncharacterized protein LOC114523822 n=1 Tax=Dendronephthya gigantea TaxID=151771 RepID=UPI00106BD8E6|nr:uncharacterized protein LOC114523822 [Dendronephthya gigantea]
MAAKAFSKEELNFFKFASIVLDEFPKMLRSTFVTLWNTKIAPLPGYHEWDDTPEVRQLFLAREGGTPKIPVSDSFEKWDCTALFQATIYSKSFGVFMTSPTTKKTPTIKTLSDQYIKGKKPRPFHLSSISATKNHDETIALAIDQVRLLRNTLCHLSGSRVTKDDFDNYVRLAKDAFDAVKFSTSQIDNIAILEEEDFPTDKFNQLSKKIAADLQGSNKFLQEKLETIITTHVDESKVFQESVLQRLDKMQRIPRTRIVKRSKTGIYNIIYSYILQMLQFHWLKLDKVEENTKDQDSKKDNKTVTGQEKLLAINALCSGSSSDGGDFVFRVTAKHVKVITDMNIIADVTLGELIDTMEIINPAVFQKATKRSFGDERDDQEFKKFKKGSLLVPLHCFTDEGFLEVLDDFKSGRLKERLLKEFSLIGVTVEGMEIEIVNMDEVNKTEEAIMKRIKQGKEVNEKQRLKEKGSVEGPCDDIVIFPTKGFNVIAKAKEEDEMKRKNLEEFYFEIEECVRQLDVYTIPVLNVYYGNRSILNVLAEQRRRLTNTEYNILIAGESSAGKSSLVNLILGEELLPHHALNTTSTICEVKYGKERKLIAHYNYDERSRKRRIPTIQELKTKEECGKNYCDQIAPFVQMQCDEREKGSRYTRVEIFWPHELLQEGVVIIDSPGLGESDDMDEVLMKYLSNALVFIYVLDTSRAGGVQKEIKEKLRTILKKVKSSSGGPETLQHLAECSIFICNKWDQVEEDERSETKKHVVAKLRECWEDSNLNHQMVYMSIKDAIKAHEYGGVTEEFSDLLKKIETLVLKARNISLYNQWQWLYTLLCNIHRVAYFFNQVIQSSHKTTREKMEFIKKRIEKIEKQEQEVKQDMAERVEYQTKVLLAKLEEYIHSMDFKTKFCSWDNCAFPPHGITWEVTKSNVNMAIDNRFKELLIEWENDHQVYAEIHRQLLDEFRTRLNLLEEELQGVDKAMHSVERQADYLKNQNKISTTTKVIFGATSPLWIPFGVAGLVIGMPVLGAMAVKREVSTRKMFDNYQNNPRDYLEKESEKYLERLPKEYVLQYAQRQMKNTKMVLSKYGDQIPILIEADRKLVTQLINDTRSQDEILKLYDPIQKKSSEMINRILPWGIKVCPETINASDLEWKPDKNSLIGEGESSRVYRGKLSCPRTKSQTSEMEVAVKVFEYPFDNPNSKFFLYEELKIRDLHHENVLKYFGATRISTPLSSYKYKFVFVMQAGRQNLRSAIFRDRSLTPAESENPKLANGKFIKRAMDIAAGLNYIHERGLIHRHLKLENILEDEDGTAMISDVGIAGRFLETEKSMPYLAPEVLENLTNRTKKADIYSYGIMLWEMWYGTQAFTELMPIDKVKFREKIADGYRPKIDQITINIPEIHAVMVRCWATEAEERHSAKKCYEIFQEMIEKEVSEMLAKDRGCVEMLCTEPSEEIQLTSPPPENTSHQEFEQSEINRETLLKALADIEKEIEKLNQVNLATRVKDLRAQVSVVLEVHSNDIRRLNAEIDSLKEQVEMLKAKNDELNNKNEQLMNKLAVAQTTWEWEAHLARFVIEPRTRIYSVARFKQMQRYLKRVGTTDNLWKKIQDHYGKWTNDHWEKIYDVRSERNCIAHPDFLELDLVESEILNMPPDFHEPMRDMLAMLKTTASLMKFGRLTKFFTRNNLFPSGKVGSEELEPQVLKDITSWDREFEQIDGLQNIEHQEAKGYLAKYVNQPEKITQYFSIVDLIKSENKKPLGKLAWEFETRYSSRMTNEEKEALAELKKLAPENERKVRILDATIAKLHIPDFLPKHLWKHGLKIVDKYSKL